MELAALCSVLRIPVDIDRLYREHDPEYLVWLRMVIDRTVALRREADEGVA